MRECTNSRYTCSIYIACGLSKLSVSTLKISFQEANKKHITSELTKVLLNKYVCCYVKLIKQKHILRLKKPKPKTNPLCFFSTVGNPGGTSHCNNQRIHSQHPCSLHLPDDFEIILKSPKTWPVYRDCLCEENLERRIQMVANAVSGLLLFSSKLDNPLVLKAQDKPSSE